MSEGELAYEALVQFLYRAPVALIQLQKDGAIELLNPMASRLLMPLAPDGDMENFFHVLRRHAPDLPQLCAQFSDQQGVVCEGRRIVVDETHGAADGPAVLSLGLLKLDDNRLMAVLLDATHEVVREQRLLASAAQLDTLTQLPNRAGTMTLLRKMTARTRSATGDHCAVLLVNLDRFKQVNDTLGNAAGNQVITLVGERLRSTLRSGGRPGDGGMVMEAVTRVGGDEFAVLLDGLPEPGVVERIASRLLERLGLPYRVREQELALTFSLGLVVLKTGENDADDLLRDAAIAMAVAKAQGGNRAVAFEQEMRDQALLRSSLEADLRTAVERAELFNVYQPVVGLLADGHMDPGAGVEALVRWRHPVRGLVSPIDFIGIAESTGLIHAIGEQVLATACRDFVAWQRQLSTAAPRLLAVNLSRAQLTQADLCDRVAAILAASGMPAAQLQLEITESLAAQGADIQHQLLGLKQLGVKLALDDFGTGYSSLSSLHLLPVDTVKIDRSFVSLAASSAHHKVLIEATVLVARSLGMTTVAEGIETLEQANVAHAQGCDKGQGYLYSRPLESAALQQWLTAHAAQPAAAH
ncbi:putative bifunctional diguanylate cyclase/phosphodiesterase [Duganella phyllosphaerae]|uniref:Phytochrome-like protein cph2 n=1 Tax=Duganella phyllosphaerae TaxID=762836 RepID=A0A1E7WZK6_9BURK|nr:bifunctional diguanylate cyclase/phosphodiesterase [Duganella phyllosphaerae]OFA05419.1 phytochrome-like protein cph2 [Duganella phyllosphaerae]